jgi:phosphoserine aminotransferase
MNIPWNKLDVTTFSWQKVLGGEAQHGILVLSPRAVERLESYKPAWPIPKLFRLTNKGKFQSKIFKGSTINTPSMLCIEDAIHALEWVDSIGGLTSMIERSQSNLEVIEKWESKTDWVEFLATIKEVRSSTSICLKIIDPWFLKLDADSRKKTLNKFFSLLEEKGAAYDINHYPSAPEGIRIWGGGTVEKTNIELLLPWLDWAWKYIAK